MRLDRLVFDWIGILTMTSKLWLPTFLLLSIFLTPLAAQRVERFAHNGPRPLNRIAGELIQKFGYLINYEEAAYPDRDLVNEKLPDGRPDRYPKFKPMIFSLPATPGRSVEMGVSRRGLDLPSLQDTVELLITTYHQGGNPGQFSARFEDGTAHIIQTGHRTESGATQKIEPVFDTIIHVTPATQSCNATLLELSQQLAEVRRVRVVLGLMSMNRVLTKSCTVVGSDLTARQVLGQILRQMGDNGPSYPPSQLLYDIEYDANWNAFFLNVVGAPAPPAEAHSREPAFQPPPDSTSARPPVIPLSRPGVRSSNVNAPPEIQPAPPKE
jgi:hypothetical protein